MRLILLAILSFAGPSLASAKAAGPAETRGTVEMLGYGIPTPEQVDQPVEWEAVRDHVPAVLHETPAVPMSAREIYNEVNRLMRVVGAEDDSALGALAIARQGDFPDLRLETVTLILAETFLSRAGEDVSPEVQRLALDYSALVYLMDAFKAEREVQGYGPVRDSSEPVPET